MNYNSELAMRDVRAYTLMAFTVRDAIRELGTVPSGHLYAVLAGSMTLTVYEDIITLLIETKQITRDNHLLTWVG